MRIRIGLALGAALFGLATAGCTDKRTQDGKGRRERRAAANEGVSPNAPLPAAAAGTSGDHTVPPSGEGMWPWTDLGKLDERALQKRGLGIKLADLWAPGQGGLALAVVGLRGCTASFVSPDGLLITNHHCAFTAIQRNSTPNRDLITNGFLARNRSEELNGYGVTVLVFKNQTDVTQQIVGKIPDNASDHEIIRHIERREKALVARCEKTPNTRCHISRENNGLRFLLLQNLELRDVRLTAAPPRGLGEFGGEVDNWQWPRHTMDFALLRAYVAKDGTPAPHSRSNVPYRPERYLKINPRGIHKGDFVMVLGRPYHTARYVTSGFLRQQYRWYYPARKRLFAEWISVLERTARQTPEARLPTSSTLKGLNNGLTHARGMLDGMRRRNLLEKKRSIEEKWTAWAKKQSGPGHLKTLRELEAYHRRSQSGRNRDLVIRYMLRGVRLLGFARTITRWAAEQQKKDPDREPGYQSRDRDRWMSMLKHAQRSLHVEADRAVMAMFLARMGELSKAERLKLFDLELGADYSEPSIRRYVDRLYSKTRLNDLDYRMKLFGRSTKSLAREQDSMIQLALSLTRDLDDLDKKQKERQGALFRLRRPYLRSYIQFRGRRFYPDANGSPRATFANVAGYTSSKGVWQTPFTTLAGLVRKHTGKEPFNAPANILDAARKRDFGRYAAKPLEDVPVCFLSNADTTGGNSGSPALDGRGELVGVNFDRVYENIAGDFGYSPVDSRNIMVDIRAILWYLDRVLKAEWILRELLGRTDPNRPSSR